MCIDCLQHADVGQRCPECAEVQPAATAATKQVDRRTTPVTFWLLGANVAIFLLMVLPSLGGLVYEQMAQSNYFIFASDQWWRIITAAFLHSDIVHLLFNMWALYLFGPSLERHGGSVAYLVLYMASAAAGGLLYFLLGSASIDAPPAVGASGAIFGLFGAWLVAAFQARRTSFGQQQLRSMLTLLAINLAFPFFMPRIAWEAHVGGLIAGALIGAVWFTGDHGSRGRNIAAGVVVLVLAVAAVLLVRPLQPFG